jgi:hypothetical protein
MWVNSTTNSNAGGGTVLIGNVTSGGAANGNWFLAKDVPSAGNISFYASDGSTYQINGIGGGSVNDGLWHHVAATRSGSSFRVFIDGVQVGSTGTWAGTIASTSRPLYIGYNTTAAYMTGYMSNVRFVKGTALYTATFTPPTQLFNVSGTNLLTCQSPTIIDNSSNAFAITTNGNAAVSNFTPFTGYTAYNPALGAATPGVWTVSDALQAAQTRRWNMYDPYFQNTTLLLHGNGTNGAQNNTFLDSSTNNFSITRNGNTTQGTFSPFSQTGWSNYFNGTDAYLTAAQNAAFNLGTGQFTVECWVYWNGTTLANGGYGLVNLGGGANGGGPYTGWGLIMDFDNSGKPTFYRYDGTAYSYQSSTTLTANQWNHIAVSRNSSNTLSMWINGTRVYTGTVTTSFNNVNTDPLYIGRRVDGGTGGTHYFPGYISNVRVVPGTDVYGAANATITVPTSPLTAISGTALLTCQSNRFIDNSSNAFAITVNSSPSVQSFSPFAPTAAYSASTNGGSGYFDGTGDYLSLTNTATFGTGDWTVEAWIYFTTIEANDSAFIDGRPTGGSSTGWLMNVRSSNKVLRFASASAYEGTTALKANSWNHVAATYTGSTLRLYVNGAIDGTFTSLSFNFSDTNFVIGKAHYSDGDWNGYISGLRLIKGTAEYTGSTYTMPTAPPTAITNTSLLLNFTNGGIIDAAGKNVLETAGNAQISTTQSKWGGSSMSFPATNGNYFISPPNQQNFIFGTGQFTVELWVYPTAFTNSAAGIVGYGLSGGYVDWNLELNTSGTLLYIDNNAGRVSASSNLSLNTWTHIAVARTATAVTVYFNGTSVATYSTINNISGSSTSALLYVGTGAQVPASRQFIGYIDDLRITKGYARYTANFTPQTSQWQDQ